MIPRVVTWPPVQQPRSRRRKLTVTHAMLFPTTFWSFPREFSPLRLQTSGIWRKPRAHPSYKAPSVRRNPTTLCRSDVDFYGSRYRVQRFDFSSLPEPFDVTELTARRCRKNSRYRAKPFEMFRSAESAQREVRARRRKRAENLTSRRASWLLQAAGHDDLAF